MLPPDLPSLLDQYIRNAISEEDFRHLWKTLQDPSQEAVWNSAIQKTLDHARQQGLSDPETARKALTSIQAMISEPAPTVAFYRMKIFRYAAAVLLLTASAAITWIGMGRPAKHPAALTYTLRSAAQPGGQKALLTLADGSTIVLDNVAAGKIAEQGHVQVIKAQNGQLQYRVAGGQLTPEGTAALNTMSTPRGGQYQVILPDGSRVWLNAESSITYPVAFSGPNRKVKMSGEAYFEVARNNEKPFIVETRKETVEVLGTDFNVNAYADEGTVRTSLLQGSVRVGSNILQPGQAFQNGNVTATDVEQDIAWKNGVFNFNDKDLTQIMRQLARWYDLDVSYPHGIPHKEYGGEIGRNLGLSQVLKGLENSGVRFTLRGRTLTVENE